MKLLFWTALLMGLVCCLCIYLFCIQHIEGCYAGAVATGFVFIFECGLYLHLDNELQRDWVRESNLIEKQ